MRWLTSRRSRWASWRAPSAAIVRTNLAMVMLDARRGCIRLRCVELLQLTFFIRAQRRGGTFNYIALAFFTPGMSPLTSRRFF